MKQRPAGVLARGILACFIFLLCISVCCCSIAEKTGKVHGGWLILRSMPSYSGKQISSYPSGTIVTITGQNGSWYEVTAPDGLKGYMLGKYLYVSGDDIIEGGDAWVTSTNGLNVRLREGPGTQYRAIASYTPGTKCAVLEKLNKWCRIRIGNFSGYMMTKFLTGSDPGAGGGGGGGTILRDVYVTSTNGKGVNLRSSAYKGNNVIGFYEVGTKAGLISKGASWSLIHIDGKTGYMMNQFLTNTKPDPVEPTGKSYVISYNGKSVNLRDGPGKKYQVLGAYSPGTPVTVITVGTEWDFVRINGKYGYMMDQYILTK